DRIAPYGIRPESGIGRPAARPDLDGLDLGQGDPPRRRRRHQPRAGGRRGDRPHQADPGGVTIMQALVPAIVISTLLLALPGARAADLVVWWEKGFYPQEDAAVGEIIAAFEQASGKRVALSQPAEDELPAQVAAALEAGQPPDFAFGVLLQDYVGP